MKILGLIPARGGSKGVPFKNQRILAGKPLISYTIEAAIACHKLDNVVVSTDSDIIATLSQKAGAEVPFLRPEALAKDNSPSIDVVLHALAFYENQGVFFDAFCLLQPTCPLRKASDITEAINKFSASEADSLISVRTVPHQYNPHWIFEPSAESEYLKISTGEEEIIPRRQALPKAFYRDGSIYITRTETLKTSKSLYGEKITWHESKSPFYVNIDTLSDWEKAEHLIKAQKR